MVEEAASSSPPDLNLEQLVRAALVTHATDLQSPAHFRIWQYRSSETCHGLAFSSNA